MGALFNYMLCKVTVNDKLFNSHCKGSGFLREVLYIADIKEVTSVAINARPKLQGEPHKGAGNIHAIHTFRCERILGNTVNIYRNARVLHCLWELKADISDKGSDRIDSTDAGKVCKG